METNGYCPRQCWGSKGALPRINLSEGPSVGEPALDIDNSSFVDSGVDQKEGPSTRRMSEIHRTEWKRVVGVGF